MQTRKFKKFFMLSVFLIILLMPFHDRLAMRNEAHAAKLKVLLIPREGEPYEDYVIIEEPVVMKTMLEQAGFKVMVATISGKNVEGQKYKLKTDKKLSDVDVTDYAGIIMACMAVGQTEWHARPEEIALVQEAVAHDILIAAQQGSVIILAEAGVLAGKKFSYGMKPYFNESFDNAIYSGTGIVQDGNIITSSYNPWFTKTKQKVHGTFDLTDRFIEALKE
jgi:putative intracellular protease/amidase